MAEADELADEYVDGTSVDVVGIVRTTVAATLLSAAVGLVLFVSAAARALEGLVLATADGVGRLVGDVLGVPLAWFELGARTTADGLAWFGPAAFPLAIGLTLLALVAIWTGVNRLGS